MLDETENTAARAPAPCPDRPNCVSSMAQDPRHFIAPLAVDDDPERAFRRLGRLIQEMPGSRLIKYGDTYIHAECRTRWLRFIDDLECYLDRNAAVIHIRSASRLGYSDLGVNRRRVERLRRMMAAND